MLTSLIIRECKLKHLENYRSMTTKLANTEKNRMAMNAWGVTGKLTCADNASSREK